MSTHKAYRAPDPGCPPAKPCDGHVDTRTRNGKPYKSQLAPRATDQDVSPQSGTHAGTHLGLAGLTSHDHGTGYQLSTNALTGKLLQGPGNTREQRGMHGSISSFGDDSAHKKRAQRAQQHTHPSARASHLPSPTPPPCSTTVALRQLGAYTCLQHASAFERRSTRPTHRLPHSPHTRERRRPHAHDARHASALRASHSFGRRKEKGRFQPRGCSPSTT